MTYLARKTLFNRVTRWVYTNWNAIPVDQDRPDMASLKTIIRKLKEGHRVLVFPEGSRTLDGTIGEAAPGIGLVAAKSAVPIQPVRISGAREALPRGSARIHFARITVEVGPAIHLTPQEIQATKGKEDYDRIAKRIMAAIESLPDRSPDSQCANSPVENRH
jgi:1-acyl-sn-glycerol-3-phosphate acyltransferase